MDARRSRPNADDRFPVYPHGRLESGDRIVEGRGIADIRPFPQPGPSPRSPSSVASLRRVLARTAGDHEHGPPRSRGHDAALLPLSRSSTAPVTLIGGIRGPRPEPTGNAALSRRGAYADIGPAGDPIAGPKRNSAIRAGNWWRRGHDPHPGRTPPDETISSGSPCLSEGRVASGQMRRFPDVTIASEGRGNGRYP